MYLGWGLVGRIRRCYERGGAFLREKNTTPDGGVGREMPHVTLQACVSSVARLNEVSYSGGVFWVGLQGISQLMQGIDQLINQSGSLCNASTAANPWLALFPLPLPGRQQYKTTRHTAIIAIIIIIILITPTHTPTHTRSRSRSHPLPSPSYRKSCLLILYKVLFSFYLFFPF